jgi:ADP-heptose:LPS heptosyltransferase
MKTVITIDGGIGRALTALPAILYFAEKHKDNEFYVLIHGWDFLSWGFPQLQNRTFNPEDKGTFNRYFWNADKIISPEPYRDPEYYRGEINLIQAFHKQINESTDYENLPKDYIKLSQFEKLKGLQIVSEVKELQKKKKTIVIQPYGSTATLCPIGVFDTSFRSFPQKFYENLAEKLSKKYNIVYMGANEFHDTISYKPQPDPNMREWIGIIEAADYFIGCDSCGQHFAKAVGKKASVLIAGTDKNSVSYPDDFHIIERDCEFYPAPMRICSNDSALATRLNEERIHFTEEEMKNAYDIIIENIEGKVEESIISKKIKEVSSNVGRYV